MSCGHANKLFLLATRPLRLQVLPVESGNALALANPGYSNLHFTPIRSLAVAGPTPAQRVSMSSKRREETSAMLDPTRSHCHPLLLYFLKKFPVVRFLNIAVVYFCVFWAGQFLFAC